MDDITKQIFDPDDVGIDEAQTAAALKVKPATLATWRSQGRGPKYRKAGRRVEYTPRFIKEFLNANVCVPTSAKSRRQQGVVA